MITDEVVGLRVGKNTLGGLSNHFFSGYSTKVGTKL